jgi:sugar lactone lactonase YvrE
MDRVVDGLVFPEGPLWHGGRLYYVEVYGHRVGFWDGTAATVFWHRPGSGPCAIERAADGAFLVPCFDAGALARLAPDGTLTAWRTHGDDGHPLTGANDLVMDDRGGAWVTASGRWDVNAPPEGAVFRLGADGRLNRVVAGLHFSNGIALVDGGRTLVVAETLARRLTAYPIREDGTLGPGRVYLNLDDLGPLPEGADASAGPDGLERHPSGDLWVCDYGAGRVHVLDAAGRAKRTIVTPTPFVTNVAFGPDGRHAYLTVVDQPTEAPFRGAVWRVEA